MDVLARRLVAVLLFSFAVYCAGKIRTLDSTCICFICGIKDR